MRRFSEQQQAHRDLCSGRRRAGLFLLALCLALGCSGDPALRDPAARENTLLDLARQAADTWVATVKPGQNDWSWGNGVLMFGMGNLLEETAEGRYRNYMIGWIDHHIEQGYYIAFSDSCPPGIAAARLYAETGEPRFREVTRRIWHYLQHVAARTRDGGLNHKGVGTVSQLWVDSLFMFGIVLNEMARLEGNPAYHREIVDQIEIFSRHLLDPDADLYRHMYDERTGAVRPEEALFWARGNAWVFATLVEVLSTLPPDHPSREDLETLLDGMAGSVARYQHDSGLWHTLMNDPGTYLETSASALFAYGFHKAARLGLIAPQYAETATGAMNGILSRLYRDCQGGLIVTGTSHGTSPGNRDYYASVTTGDQVPYGVGAFLLAAVEMGGRPAPALESFPFRRECPDHPESPESYAEYVERAVYRLGRSDLEGAREDFEVLESMEPHRGEGPFGTALVDFAMTAFRVFDAFTRYTIEEITWQDFRETLRSESIPNLDRIRERCIVARDDPGFSLDIPVLLLNLRGMYTPLNDLSFDPSNTRAVLLVLDVLDGLLHLLAALPGSPRAENVRILSTIRT